MNELAAVAVGAVAPACIYALIAVGFVLIYRATRIFNFAQGQFVFISALLFVTAYNHFGSLIVAGVISLSVSMAIGAVMYLVLMRPLQGQSIFIMVMVTLILATSFLNGIIAIIWGVNVYPLNIHGYRTSIPLFLGTHTDAIDITTVVGTIVVIGGIALFLRYARFGIEMRAAAESTLLASYSGVGVLWTATISWAVAFGTCALAGIATAARSPVDSSITDLGLYAFPAIILGGLDSVPGAIIGAYALAIVRGATAAYVPSGGLYTDVAAYIFMLVILMVRPYGLFGTREFRRL